MAIALLFLLAYLQAKGQADTEYLPSQGHRIMKGDPGPYPPPASLAYIQIGSRTAVGSFAMIGDVQLIITSATILKRKSKMVQPKKIRITLGTNIVNFHTDGTQRLHANSYAVSVSKTDPTSVTGVGLVFPDQKIELTPWVYPAFFATDKPTTAWKCRMYSWGRSTSEAYGKKLNTGLRSAVMTVVDDTNCNMPSFDNKTMLCARNVKTNQIPLEGDEGTPLLCHRPNDMTHGDTVGLFTSKVLPFRRRAIEFSSIPLLRSWIEEQVKFVIQHPGEKIHFLRPFGS